MEIGLAGLADLHEPDESSYYKRLTEIVREKRFDSGDVTGSTEMNEAE